MANKNLLSKYPQFVVLYLNGLLNPWSWVEKADDMLEASRVLEPQLRRYWSVVLTNAQQGKYDKGGEHPDVPPPNLHGSYFILVSYALENLFKALIIRERSDEISSQFLQTGRLPRLINEHNLVKLSEEAKMKMDIKEEDILTRLSRQSKWKSRYPVPVELHDIRNVIQYSDGKPYFTDYYAPGDIDGLNAIVQKVRSHFSGYMNGLR
ncbi:MAG: hypothetical protein NTW48_07600 [Chloroflexi bacterium]|nr:hypothetical protein [Chloroflexota bacterium]